MYQILLIIYPLLAVALIAFILLQQGKGANMGASFGAGASNTLFGAPGSGNFMTKTTAILAFLFFVVSLAIGNITATSSHAEVKSKFEDLSSTSKVIEEAKKLEQEQSLKEGVLDVIPSTSNSPAQDSDLPK